MPLRGVQSVELVVLLVSAGVLVGAFDDLVSTQWKITPEKIVDFFPFFFFFIVCPVRKTQSVFGDFVGCA